MLTYIRPSIEQVTFRDEASNVIDYGNRWSDGPPDDSYEVIEHPERFDPLHTVANALVDFLLSQFEVSVEEGYYVTDGLTNTPKAEDVIRAVRLTPVTDGCAPIVFILTRFPDVRLYAGVHFANSFPVCGCNACDENWPELATELEWQALAIAGGGFTEEVSEPRRPKWTFDWKHGLSQGMGQTVSFKLSAIDGHTEMSGSSRAESVPAAVLEQIRTKGSWQPWSLTSERPK